MSYSIVWEILVNQKYRLPEIGVKSLSHQGCQCYAILHGGFTASFQKNKQDKILQIASNQKLAFQDKVINFI